MLQQDPKLFGIKYSNRNFSKADTWGKNQFNSSFPASLMNYLASRNICNVYLKLSSKKEIIHDKISTTEVYGIDYSNENLFFAFESIFTPYEQLLVGKLPRVDLVLQSRNVVSCLRALEIKLTALPDNSTCNFKEDEYGCEIVVRPDTIVYLACSIVNNFKSGKEKENLKSILNDNFPYIIEDWSHGKNVTTYLHKIITTLDKINLSLIDKQEPFLVQPVWKTKGKSLKLADNCLDVFVWSNLSFTQLFLNIIKTEFKTEKFKISRQVRSIIWLFKMILDFSTNEKIEHQKIIDNLSYNTKNDKAFAVSGRLTHHYMKCDELTNPRIHKNEIKNIILGGGQNLLSPERRFDAIIYSSPEIFD